MPKGKTDTKRFEKQEKRHRRNRAVRSEVRTYITRARAVIDTAEGEQASADAVKRAIIALDKAAKKGVIHANNAARRKSRLMKRLNAATAAAE